MERADEQILPALYAFVAASFHIGPTQLGYLTLSRALIQALASPLGGILGGPPALQFQPNDTSLCSWYLCCLFPVSVCFHAIYHTPFDVTRTKVQQVIMQYAALLHLCYSC